jgi:hypothetical protein
MAIAAATSAAPRTVCPAANIHAPAARHAICGTKLSVTQRIGSIFDGRSSTSPILLPVPSGVIPQHWPNPSSWCLSVGRRFSTSGLGDNPRRVPSKPSCAVRSRLGGCSHSRFRSRGRRDLPQLDRRSDARPVDVHPHLRSPRAYCSQAHRCGDASSPNGFATASVREHLATLAQAM